MKINFSAAEAALDELLEEIADEIDDARQGAVKDTAALAVRLGRANIAAAGFPSRWQRGLTSRFYPNEGDDPAALVYHRIGLAGVFERGVKIEGRPLLWLPIEDNLPRGVHSPKQYGKPLVSVNIAGRAPLLFDKFDRLAGPLFIGQRSVEIKKRFDLYRIFAAAAERMQDFYQQRLKG